MAEALLQTTVVGSYPQPDWLINRQMLSKVVPRTRLRELWRVAEPFLEQAQDDATLLAIRDMERAGIDIITDGEMRRESYSNRFATALDGIDDEHPAEIVNNRGQKTAVPRVVGKIRRTKPVELRDMQFLRANTKQLAKITLGVLKDLAPKKVMLGVIDLADPEVETPQKVADRIRAGLKFMAPDKLLPAPDCGMKYLPRATAFGKLKSLAAGAAIVRQELA